MPTNFTGALETRGSGLTYTEVPVQDVSANILRAGEAVSNLAEVFKQDKSEQALGAFSAEIADVENQYISYKDQEAELLERIQEAATVADANVINGLRGKLKTLREGRVQGTLSPTAARTYTNRLIKDYSMQYPSLAQKVRSMANESMDNIREIHNELFSQDPILKESADLMAEAAKNGTSPENILAMRRASAESAAAKTAYELQEAAGKVDTKTTIKYVQADAFRSALVDSNALFMQINNVMASGAEVTQDQILNQFTALEQNYLRRFTGSMIEKGAYSEDNMKNAMAPAFAIFSQVRQMLTTQGGTLEEKVKLAKAHLELLNTDRESKALGLGSMLGGIFQYMPPDAVWDAVQAASQISTSMQYGAGFGMQDWAVAARGAAGTGNMELGMGMMILQSDQGQRVLGELIGIKAFGAGASNSNHPGIKDPVLDTASNRAINDMVARMRDPAQRQKTVGNALPYFSWIDLKMNPAILAETRDNPQFRTHAMEQASSYASEWLIDMEKFGLSPNDIVINHNNMQSPFTIKGESVGNLNWNTYFQGRTPDYRELKALPVSERLNFMYRDILNTYGATGVNEWLDILGFKAEGAYRKPDPTESSKKKVATKFDEVFSSVEQKYGIPKGLLSAIAGVESSYNPNAMGPVLEDGTRAMGIMQIIPKWHPGVNAMNPQESINYAGSYLKGLYAKFGSWDKALAAYNWGEGPERMGSIANDPNWKDKLPKGTKEYIKKILG